MNPRSADDWKRWLDELSKGENVEAWRGILCFLRWIQVRSESGHSVPSFLMGLEGDLEFSQLLRRLLAGKEPLPFPPPEANGAGWYELVEAGRAIVQDVKPWEWAPDQKIAINQGIWTILEKPSETEYIITYRPDGERYRLIKQGNADWLLERVG